jgi:hypothetical protein
MAASGRPGAETGRLVCRQAVLEAFGDDEPEKVV